MMEMLRCLVPLLAVAAQWFLSFLVAKSKREGPVCYAILPSRQSSFRGSCLALAFRI